MKKGKSRKRICSALLAVVLTFSALGLGLGRTANAATSAGYVWPVNGGGMSQGFYQEGNSYGHAAHYAIDIVSNYGAPIYAANSGTVLCASTASTAADAICRTCQSVSGGAYALKGGGYHVVIRHADGNISIYAHLSKVTVSTNATVKAGQKVGEMGATGYADGTHLHFEMCKGSFSYSNRVNPLIYISPFSNVYADSISNTGATLNASFGAYATSIDSAGFYIGTDPNSLKKYSETLNSDGKFPNGTYVTGITYSTSKWCGTLRPGTVYYYKIWMKSYDTVYESDLKSFRTGGTCQHVWDGGNVTKDPTCGSPGVRTYTCIYCQATRTEEIPANGSHVTGSWITTEAATCTTPGTKVQRCTICGETVRTETINPTGHSYKPVVTPPTETEQGYTTYTCSKCGDTYVDDYTSPTPSVDPDEVQAIVEKKIAKAGETVTVQIVLKNAPELKSFSVSDIQYDKSRLELVKGEWLIEGILSSWDAEKKAAAIAFEENTEVNGAVFLLTFRVLDEADPGVSSIDLKITAQRQRSTGGPEWVTVKTVAGEINVTDLMRGDLTDDNFIDSEDAIHLLFYTLIPDAYPVNQNVDFNHDGYEDSNDALYLLFYTLLPDQYPLS